MFSRIKTKPSETQRSPYLNNSKDESSTLNPIGFLNVTHPRIATAAFSFLFFSHFYTSPSKYIAGGEKKACITLHAPQFAFRRDAKSFKKMLNVSKRKEFEVFPFFFKLFAIIVNYCQEFFTSSRGFRSNQTAKLER